MTNELKVNFIKPKSISEADIQGLVISYHDGPGLRGPWTPCCVLNLSASRIAKEYFAERSDQISNVQAIQPLVFLGKQKIKIYLY